MAFYVERETGKISWEIQCHDSFRSEKYVPRWYDTHIVPRGVGGHGDFAHKTCQLNIKSVLCLSTLLRFTRNMSRFSSDWRLLHEYLGLFRKVELS